VTDRYDGYLELAPERSPRARKIDPPVTSELRTEALVIALSEAVRRRLAAIPGLDRDAALHAAEHLLTAFGATFVLCDREDLEGHSGVVNGEPAVVLFDRHPGGLGFAASAFELIDAIVERAGTAVDDCPCESGCPACVHSGRCLRGNDDVSKIGARLVLRLLRGRSIDDIAQVRIAPKPVPKPRARPTANDEPRERATKNTTDQPWQDEFTPGDRVEHAVYGEGLVLEVRPSGRVVVDFGDGKPRRITPGWLRKAR
jgi:ATP-dependent helicase YprA (DUF1998 family)